ncbi:hypothetical protein [Oceanidesulfovibrio marinus]|uniref:Uncharacterized protein n=1 Tax=Oceanidesulfovibrio marinus TaxID=370038 RepID=A0A6P1ZGR8_9BACT|nr:hypothetical protein [Oceanidesulfovibrio marinus]QJT09251.1 hypothetical protein E8L03_10005 [Oceanidesulfovibrio marinus]TVM32746.1 hypothetical protein DQK91_13620 [Oceanidesulfovibrio marinus]
MATNGSPCPRLWLASLFAAALLVALVAVAQAEPQGPPGFNGIPWGAPREGLEHFAKLKQRGNAEFYLNTQEDFEFEGFPQPRIIYGFIEGRLYGVYVDVATQELFDMLLQRWTKEYGEPRIIDETETYVRQWRFEHLKVKLKKIKRTGAMKLAYYFLPLYEHVELALDQGAEDIDEQKLDRLYWLEMMRMRGTSMP